MVLLLSRESSEALHFSVHPVSSAVRPPDRSAIPRPVPTTPLTAPTGTAVPGLAMSPGAGSITRNPPRHVDHTTPARRGQPAEPGRGQNLQSPLGRVDRSACRSGRMAVRPEHSRKSRLPRIARQTGPPGTARPAGRRPTAARAGTRGPPDPRRPARSRRLIHHGTEASRSPRSDRIGRMNSCLVRRGWELTSSARANA